MKTNTRETSYKGVKYSVTNDKGVFTNSLEEGKWDDEFACEVSAHDFINLYKLWK